MKIHFTSSVLSRLKTLLEESGFLVRYEKGVFTSGYCLLEQKKIIIINKFLNTEGKINALLDIINIVSITNEHLSPESARLYAAIHNETISTIS